LTNCTAQVGTALSASRLARSSRTTADASPIFILVKLLCYCSKRCENVVAEAIADNYKVKTKQHAASPVCVSNQSSSFANEFVFKCANPSASNFACFLSFKVQSDR
jgi:hypothetical protein